MRVPKGVIKYLNIGIDWLHILNVLVCSKAQRALNKHKKLLSWFWGAWISSILYFVFADPRQKDLFPPIWWTTATCLVGGVLAFMLTGLAVGASGIIEAIHSIRDNWPRLKYVFYAATTACAITEPDNERDSLLVLHMPEFDSRPVEERHAILARAAGTIRHHHELALAEVIRSL